MSHEEVKIPIIGDNPHDAELTIRSLKNQNLSGKHFHHADGAEALDLIYGQCKYSDKNTDFKPKVMFLDLKIPKQDGLYWMIINKARPCEE